MKDKDPFSSSSRRHFPFSPAVPDRQLWAIGMVVVQWGMTEFLREQMTLNLIAGDPSLIERHQNLRHSNQRTEFWKELIESKMPEPGRSKNLEFVTRFESLNNQRDNIVHRLWGGGMQPGSLCAPGDAVTTDAALHRNRNEKMKTKSTDARANIRWRLTFSGLRDVALKMAQLNSEIFASFLPPGTGPGLHNVWGFLTPAGQLEVGVSPGSSQGDPGEP